MGRSFAIRNPLEKRSRPIEHGAYLPKMKEEPVIIPARGQSD
jgi:hypothetical protein